MQISKKVCERTTAEKPQQQQDTNLLRVPNLQIGQLLRLERELAVQIGANLLLQVKLGDDIVRLRQTGGQRHLLKRFLEDLDGLFELDELGGQLFRLGLLLLDQVAQLLLSRWSQGAG